MKSGVMIVIKISSLRGTLARLNSILLQLFEIENGLSEFPSDFEILDEVLCWREIAANSAWTITISGICHKR
jgi:hypothetical protein